MKRNPENISEIQVNKLRLDIVEEARNDRKFIYVYSFPKATVRAKKLASGKTHGRSLTGQKTVGKATLESKSRAGAIKKNFPQAFHSSWAVRVEGKSKPYHSDFKTKEGAIAYAKNLLEKGVGRSIRIVDNKGIVRTS